MPVTNGILTNFCLCFDYYKLNVVHIPTNGTVMLSFKTALIAYKLPYNCHPT